MLECPRNNLRVVLDLFGKELLSLNRSSILNIKLFIKEGSKIKGKNAIELPYSRESKPCLFKTHSVFGRAYFRAFSKNPYFRAMLI